MRVRVRVRARVRWFTSTSRPTFAAFKTRSSVVVRLGGGAGGERTERSAEHGGVLGGVCRGRGGRLGTGEEGGADGATPICACEREWVGVGEGLANSVTRRAHTLTTCSIEGLGQTLTLTVTLTPTLTLTLTLLTQRRATGRFLGLGWPMRMVLLYFSHSRVPSGRGKCVGESYGCDHVQRSVGREKDMVRASDIVRSS